MPWKLLTSILIVSTVMGYIIWDIIVYLKAGSDATESETVGNWLDRSLWVVLAVGLLIGHLFASGPDKVKPIQLAMFAIGFFLGFFCTVK